jgi:hypothetical protein
MNQCHFFHLSPSITSDVLFNQIPTLSIGVGDESTPAVMTIKISIAHYQNIFDLTETPFTHRVFLLFSPFFFARKNKKSV